MRYLVGILGEIRNKGFCICLILSLLQCPPFRLSYQGLGEPLCFAAFGPFASTAFYLMQGSTRLFDLYDYRAIALDFSFAWL